MAVSRPGRARVATWIVIGVLLTAALAGTLWVPPETTTSSAQATDPSTGRDDVA
jgi:hypothetical protein